MKKIIVIFGIIALLLLTNCISAEIVSKTIKNSIINEINEKMADKKDGNTFFVAGRGTVINIFDTLKFRDKPIGQKKILTFGLSTMSAYSHTYYSEGWVRIEKEGMEIANLTGELLGTGGTIMDKKNGKQAIFYPGIFGFIGTFSERNGLVKFSGTADFVTRTLAIVDGVST